MISFTKLSCPPEEGEIKFLYELLLSKEYNISHSKSPSYEEHRSFVVNHPYKTWSIIFYKNTAIGSVYTAFDNSVGINLSPQNIPYRQSVILQFLKDFVPLTGKKSILRGEFIFNVAVNDFKFEEDLRSCGAIPVQKTYSIKKNKDF